MKPQYSSPTGLLIFFICFLCDCLDFRFRAIINNTLIASKPSGVFSGHDQKRASRQPLIYFVS